jgi:hypothetical protein
MDPCPRLKGFLVIFDNGRKLKKKIESVYILEQLIFHYGIHTIKKIIFDFYSDINEYFPYSIHNIVFENTGYGFFNTIFYHYYNCNNKRIDIPIEQKWKDYESIMNLIYYHSYLYNYFGRYIIDPFISTKTNFYLQMPLSSPPISIGCSYDLCTCYPS